MTDGGYRQFRRGSDAHAACKILDRTLMLAWAFAIAALLAVGYLVEKYDGRVNWEISLASITLLGFFGVAVGINAARERMLRVARDLETEDSTEPHPPSPSPTVPVSSRA